MCRLITTAIALLLTAAPVRAQECPQREAARRELESAKTQLQDAGHDYGGPRTQAIEHVNRFAAIGVGLAVLRGAVGMSQLPPRLQERLRGSVQRAGKASGSAESQLTRGRRGRIPGWPSACTTAS